MAYSTYKTQVQLRPGETLAFTAGKGYYAKPAPAPAASNPAPGQPPPGTRFAPPSPGAAPAAGGGGGGGGGPVTDAPIPGVSAYGADMSRAQGAYDNAVAFTKGTLTNNLQTLGFNSDGSVSGQNAYGSFQQNRRQGAQQQEAITNSGARRGIGLFGGLADQAREDANNQSGAGLAGILGQAGQANLNANADIQSAGNTLQERLAQAQLSAAQTNVEGRNFTEAAQPGTPAAAAAPAAAPKAAPKSGGFSWGGQTITSKAQLVSILSKSGVSYATWAANHPSAAASL